jgi:hypothetical protein
MVAEFLRQEYANRGRFGAAIDDALEAEGVTLERVTVPDLTDQVANEARRRVLARYRGYGTGRPSYLTGFPDTGVEWTWVVLTPDELLNSHLIRYLADHELAAGTRSARKAAHRIRNGDLASAFAERVCALADQLRDGKIVPPVILVSADGGQTRVILEGHTRITAWALAPETIPAETVVILGTSPDIAMWDEY